MFQNKFLRTAPLPTHTIRSVNDQGNRRLPIIKRTMDNRKIYNFDVEYIYAPSIVIGISNKDFTYLKEVNEEWRPYVLEYVENSNASNNYSQYIIENIVDPVHYLLEFSEFCKQYFEVQRYAQYLIMLDKFSVIAESVEKTASYCNSFGMKLAPATSYPIACYLKPAKENLSIFKDILDNYKL